MQRMDSTGSNIPVTSSSNKSNSSSTS
ncbi:unnamed protein product, partial [Rotaria magnacalcarata]